MSLHDYGSLTFQSMFKRVLFVFTFFLGVTQLADAQGFFVKPRIGYNFQNSKSIIETNTQADSTNFTTVSPIFVSLGGGSTFGLDLGYYFNDHVGVKAGFQMLRSTKEEALANQTPISDITALAYTRQGQAVIGGVVSTNDDPVSVYAEAGAVLPLFGATTVEVNFVSETFNADEFTRTEAYGKFSVGFYGGLGVEYRLNDLLGLSLEGRFTNLRIKVLQDVLLERTDRINNIDLLATTPEINITTDYVDQLTPSSNNPDINPDFSADQPLEELSYTSNYSNLSFQLGFGFYFNRKSDEIMIREAE